jgi:ribosomal protein S18 acetylase RimI-like enzyme
VSGAATSPAEPSPAGIRTRRLTAQEWPAYRALRLRSLADAPDAFCSSHALEESWAHELWMARLMAASVSGRDCPLVAEADDTMLGLLWAKCDTEDAGIVNLFQMWVAPEARGRGVAAALVDEAVAWARSIQARLVRLGVVSSNQAAIQLYMRKGFGMVGTPEPILPGSARLEQIMHLPLLPQR